MPRNPTRLGQCSEHMWCSLVLAQQGGAMTPTILRPFNCDMALIQHCSLVGGGHAVGEEGWGFGEGLAPSPTPPSLFLQKYGLMRMDWAAARTSHLVGSLEPQGHSWTLGKSLRGLPRCSARAERVGVLFPCFVHSRDLSDTSRSDQHPEDRGNRSNHCWVNKNCFCNAAKGIDAAFTSFHKVSTEHNWILHHPIVLRAGIRGLSSADGRSV